MNRLAAEAGQENGRLRRELGEAEKRLGHLIEAVASWLRSNSLQAKLAEMDATKEQLVQQLAAAPPSAMRLMPNLGQTYRDILARLAAVLAKAQEPEALVAARRLIERVVIHSSPRPTPPGLTAEWPFAAMLMTGQPGPSPDAAARTARAAMASDTEASGGQRPPPGSPVQLAQVQTSNRSRFITLVQAAMKSCTNFVLLLSWP